MTVYDNVIKAEPTPAANDRFSWNRVGQLYAYYSPVVKKQCTIYFSFSALCAILMMLPVNEMLQVGFFTVIWTAIPLMYLMAPCAFGKHDASPAVERLLPVKTTEKLAFFFTYLLIVLPLALYTLPCTAMWLYLHIPALHTGDMMRLYEIKMHNPLIIRGLNLVTELSGLLTCLCVVETARTNKIFKGIISVIAVNFVEGLLGAIYGMNCVFQEGYKAGKSGMNMENPNAFTMQIMDEMANASGYMIFMYTLFMAYSAFLVWLLYRTLKHRNL